jgi:ribose 5-phosphate isomerase B
MKVALGSDHAGFALKTHLKTRLAGWGHEVLDLGTGSAESVDYPDFGAAVGRAVVEGKAERGVCVCGSGIGISIAANKVAGVRAALVGDQLAARLSREHNDANVICFGERLIGIAHAEAALEVFLATAFSGGRHAGRVDKLRALEA